MVASADLLREIYTAHPIGCAFFLATKYRGTETLSVGQSNTWTMNIIQTTQQVDKYVQMGARILMDIQGYVARELPKACLIEKPKKGSLIVSYHGFPILFRVHIQIGEKYLTPVISARLSASGNCRAVKHNHVRNGQRWKMRIEWTS